MKDEGFFMIDFDKNFSSPNFNGRGGKPISLIVVHYTGMQTAQEALQRLCDSAAQVSAHYCIDEGGKVFQLVKDEHRAWHAGASYWGGERDVNSISLGIELVNPGHEFGYRPFPKVQMESLLSLLQNLIQKYNIDPHRVVGHSDIAPLRKQDPGELFDWAWLAKYGIGLWPNQEQSEKVTMDEEKATAILKAIGYDTDLDLSVVLTAFQRHFCPQAMDGSLNQATKRILKILAECV